MSNPTDQIDVLEALREVAEQKRALRPVPVLWPEIRSRYLIQVWLRDTGDRFECVGFDVARLGRGGLVGSSVMRSLPIGELISKAIHHQLSGEIERAERVIAEPPPEMVVDGEVVLADDEFMAAKRAHYEDLASRARERERAVSGEGTGRRYPPGHLEEVALIVRAARRRGEPTAGAVADMFGVSKSAAANQISRARARGLLDDEGDH